MPTASQNIAYSSKQATPGIKVKPAEVYRKPEKGYVAVSEKEISEYERKGFSRAQAEQIVIEKASRGKGSSSQDWQHAGYAEDGKIVSTPTIKEPPSMQSSQASLPPFSPSPGQKASIGMYSADMLLPPLSLSPRQGQNINAEISPGEAGIVIKKYDDDLATVANPRNLAVVSEREARPLNWFESIIDEHISPHTSKIDPKAVEEFWLKTAPIKSGIAVTESKIVGGIAQGIKEDPGRAVTYGAIGAVSVPVLGIIGTGLSAGASALGLSSSFVADLGVVTGLGLTTAYGYSVFSRTTGYEISQTGGKLGIEDKGLSESQKAYNFGKILGTEIIPLGIGAAVSSQISRITSNIYDSLTRHHYVPESYLVEPKVLSGEKRFPSTFRPSAKETEYAFKMESQRLSIMKLSGYKGEGELMRVESYKTLPFSAPPTGFHATPSIFWKGEIVAGAGSSEIPGIYVAPSVSKYFLKLSPDYLGGIGGNIFQLHSRPAVAELTPKGFKISGYAKTKPYEINGQMFKYKLTSDIPGGYAAIPGMKSEKEAIFPVGTVFKRYDNSMYTLMGGIGKEGSFLKFITGRTIPVDRFIATGEVRSVMSIPSMFSGSASSYGASSSKTFDYSLGAFGLSYSKSYKPFSYSSYSFPKPESYRPSKGKEPSSYVPSSSGSKLLSYPSRDPSGGPSGSYIPHQYTPPSTPPPYTPPSYAPSSTPQYIPSYTPPSNPIIAFKGEPIKIGFGRVAAVKGIFGKQPKKYQPSVRALVMGIKSVSLPKMSFTGIGVRPMIGRRRRRK